MSPGKIHRIAAFIVLFYTLILPASAQVGSKPNVVFIVIDDLNDYIGVLQGQPQVNTPVLDSLVKRGYVFYNSFCNVPVCAPSRTSFLSGKDPYYTKLYDNNSYIDTFRTNFNIENGNAEVFTLPEYLKDAGGYFTYGINKVFHNPAVKDYDNSNPDPCEKTLSWSKVVSFTETDEMKATEDSTNFGIEKFVWGMLDNSDEPAMRDYRAVDTAIAFIQSVASGETALCDANAFFLALGISLPHLDLYVPEKYFPADYLPDMMSNPFNRPYNYPENSLPYNGIVMPPQPDPRWNDYLTLGPLAQSISIGQSDVEQKFQNYIDAMPQLPKISAFLSDEERVDIVAEALRADAQMAYIAAVQFVDAQLGRLFEVMQSYPDMYNNTIICIVGDNGFTLGEKHHWLKRSLWDTDIRVPFILIDPAYPGNKICYQTVGLLDVFPTLCDLTNTPLPVFSDSSQYLDGKSLKPILDAPEILWERPVLVSWEAELNKECSCFPQYAVRDGRFHYIMYHSDGGDPEHSCDASLSFKEEELYEVGVKRETDPNEWHNLINDPDYRPVVEYLDNWLPDSSMYLQKAMVAKMNIETAPCFYAQTDTVKCNASLFDTTGFPAFAEDYLFRWTNNLTTDTLWGSTLEFPINAIDDATFHSRDHMLFYLHVFDADNRTVAFATENIYIDPENTPELFFDVFSVSPDYYITGFNITGAYTSFWWDLGNGPVLTNSIPGMLNFGNDTSFSITLNVQYGNGCVTTLTRSGANEVHIENTNYLQLYPNPADNSCMIFTMPSEDHATLTIYHLNGDEVQHFDLENNTFTYTFDTSGLSPGMYIIVLQTNSGIQTGKLVVIHR